MRDYFDMNVSTQVDRIRTAVRLDGFFVAGSEELAVLCSDGASEQKTTTGIEQIAEWEGWACQRLPNAMVRFSVRGQ
ncbi:MAG: hypothetical protein H0X34_08690 [Chthoniobacterales bacterium]|jgi:hypothetical protein|nr:hypothetical protein [Chthoniobacterales bacterium]